jgi:Putative zinc-finger
MSGCERVESGAVELYFYGELDAKERIAVERHVSACAECRHVLEELSVIREALAARPAVTAPPGGDWGGFMSRLDEAIQLEDRAREARTRQEPRVHMMDAPQPARALYGTYTSYLAMAALLAIVTMTVAYVARTAVDRRTESTVVSRTAVEPPAPTEVTHVTDLSSEAAFAKLSEQHFERSKLVVLGLTSKDPRRASQADWEYERQLASNLLSDTRIYRLAAEQKGMKTLADVMGDLELVLLQTALAHEADSENLEQIQRLINKRDLVTKMELVAGI